MYIPTSDLDINKMSDNPVPLQIAEKNGKETLILRVELKRNKILELDIEKCPSFIEESVKSQGEKKSQIFRQSYCVEDLKFEGEYLLLYVDRTEGNIGRENKALYRFKIVKQGDSQEPDSGKNKEPNKSRSKKRKWTTVSLPPIPWRPMDHMVEPEEYSIFENAKEMIGKINKLQGL